MMNNIKMQNASNKRGRPIKFVLAMGMAFVGLSVHAQNAIRSVTSSLQSGVEIIRIETAQAMTEVPAGFTIQSPARIALDFPGVINSIGKNLVELNQGNVRSANVVQAGDRTRVVVNLKQASAYQASIDGNVILLVLDRSQAQSSPAPKAQLFAQPQTTSISALKDIDFRRGSEDAGRVVVDLANSQVGVDIHQQGKDLVVEFLQSTLPEGLRRKLDVTDFGTPVQTIVTS